MDKATFTAAVQAYAKAHGPQAARAIYAQYGYDKTTDIPADQYAALMPLFVDQNKADAV